MSAIFRKKLTNDRASRFVQCTIPAWRAASWMSGCAVHCITIALFTRSTNRFCEKLQPDVILTQKLCDVCAVGYGTVAKLVQTLPGPPLIVNLEPTSLADIFDDIRRVANACDVHESAKKIDRSLSERV